MAAPPRLIDFDMPPAPDHSGGSDDYDGFNEWAGKKLWPAILCAVLFVIISVVNTVITRRTRAWWMLWVTFSGISEAAGYCARAWVSKHPTTDPVTAMQCFLIITPIFLALVDYIAIGKVLELVENPEKALLLGCIRPVWIARFFFASDILCIAVQGVGAAFLLNSANPSGVETGRHTMVAGLALQLFFFTVFTAITLWVLLNKNLGISKRLGAGTRPVFFSLFATVALLYLRNCFRVAEFSQPEGFSSNLAVQEKYTYGLDFIPVYVVMILFTVFHFGCYLGPEMTKHDPTTSVSYGADAETSAAAQSSSATPTDSEHPGKNPSSKKSAEGLPV